MSFRLLNIQQRSPGRVLPNWKTLLLPRIFQTQPRYHRTQRRSCEKLRFNQLNEAKLWICHCSFDKSGAYGQGEGCCANNRCGSNKVPVGHGVASHDHYPPTITRPTTKARSFLSTLFPHLTQSHPLTLRGSVLEKSVAVQWLDHFCLVGAPCVKSNAARTFDLPPAGQYIGTPLGRSH